MSNLKMIDKFKEYDRRNPDVWQLFCRFAFEAIDRRATCLSTSLIIERIRWESMLQTSGDDFKIRNDFKPFYARKFMKVFPNHDGIFKTKESIADAA